VIRFGYGGIGIGLRINPGNRGKVGKTQWSRPLARGGIEPVKPVVGPRSRRQAIGWAAVPELSEACLTHLLVRCRDGRKMDATPSEVRR